MDLGDDVVVAGFDLHCHGVALHVHRADASTALPGDLDHVRVAFEPGDVVDDLGPKIQGACRDNGLRGVDRHRHARLGDEPPHDLGHPPQFLGGGHGLREWPRALAADVENVGPFAHKLQSMRDGGLDVGMTSAV